MGTPFLTRQLNKILVAHIQKCIPNLSKQIALTLQHKERELLVFDAQLSNLDVNQMRPMILMLINKFVFEYQTRLTGKFIQSTAVECQGGARINYLFHDIFKKAINAIDPFDNLTDRDI